MQRLLPGATIGVPQTTQRELLGGRSGSPGPSCWRIDEVLSFKSGMTYLMGWKIFAKRGAFSETMRGGEDAGAPLADF